MSKKTELHETLREDGSAINWSLTSFNPKSSQGILLISQGSGCSPALSSSNVQLLIEKTPDLGILTIEKYGVNSSDPVSLSLEKCSKVYFQNHTVSQRVDDAVVILKHLRREGVWNGNLGLFGGSEGGAVVSILSHKIPEVDAVVVFSTGTGVPLSDMILSTMPPLVAAEAREEFSRIRDYPNSDEMWNGNSFKWWADIMDRKLSDDLLESKTPVLLIHGTLDIGTPVSAARATKVAFDAANDLRLTYWELESRGHQMKDASDVSHMPEVLDDVSAWLSEHVK